MPDTKDLRNRTPVSSSHDGECKGDSATPTTTSLELRIAAFEQAAADAIDPQIMAASISEHSDRKKYDFCSGLSRDLRKTRAALRACCNSNNNGHESCCTFGDLFQYTQGTIANLNRILQNLKKAEEVKFQPECFFKGRDDDELILLLDKFWTEEYAVDSNNVFRSVQTAIHVPPHERQGRSYVVENNQTKNVVHCIACGNVVQEKDRTTIRGAVYHLKCVTCIVCGANPRQKADHVTFDGNFCCSSDCIRKYDSANIRQERD